MKYDTACSQHSPDQFLQEITPIAQLKAAYTAKVDVLIFTDTHNQRAYQQLREQELTLSPLGRDAATFTPTEENGYLTFSTHEYDANPIHVLRGTDIRTQHDTHGPAIWRLIGHSQDLDEALLQEQKMRPTTLFRHLKETRYDGAVLSSNPGWPNHFLASAALRAQLEELREHVDGIEISQYNALPYTAQRIAKRLAKTIVTTSSAKRPEHVGRAYTKLQHRITNHRSSLVEAIKGLDTNHDQLLTHFSWGFPQAIATMIGGRSAQELMDIARSRFK